MRAAILYVMDVLEQCGHSLEEQLELFDSLKPLFVNKVDGEEYSTCMLSNNATFSVAFACCREQGRYFETGRFA